MKKEAGNEYQGKSIDGIGITVVATQDTVEHDSNGNTYDERAEYPVLASSVSDFRDALSQGNSTIILASDVTVEDGIQMSVENDASINFNGNTLKGAVESGSISSSDGPTNLVLSDPKNDGSYSIDSHFEILNAVSSGVADAKRVIEEAKNRLMMYGKKTYLLLDECHRWNKAQSDSVLSAIEQGYIVFIGSTTENPYVSMTKAIVSRCRLFEFHSLTDKDEVRSYLDKILDKQAFDGKGLIYGIGHAVYSISDPRERILKSYVERLANVKGKSDDMALYANIEELAPELIGEKRKIYKGVSPNVDFYSGFVYDMLGIP